MAVTRLLIIMKKALLNQFQNILIIIRMLEENPKKCSLMSGLKKLKKYNAVLCPTLFKEKISLSLIAKL